MVESYGDRKALDILPSYYNTIARWTYISPPVSSWTPGVFYTYFYNRLEKYCT